MLAHETSRTPLVRLFVFVLVLVVVLESWRAE
jgi:hypothetical protein